MRFASVVYKVGRFASTQATQAAIPEFPASPLNSPRRGVDQEDAYVLPGDVAAPRLTSSSFEGACDADSLGSVCRRGLLQPGLRL